MKIQGKNFLVTGKFNIFVRKYVFRAITCFNRSAERCRLISRNRRIRMLFWALYSPSLVRNKEHFKKAEILHMIALGKSEYVEAGVEQYFRHNAVFIGKHTRQAVNQGRADFTPVTFSELPRLFEDNYLPVDVALVQLSPPDEKGYCSFGVSVDYTKPAAECAKKLIVQVNENMPYTFGDSRIHVSQIDYVVEVNEPLIEVPRPEIGEVEKRIGEHVSSLIEDGSILQIGIGRIPEAVLSALKDKKDLGIHTELLSNGMIPLVESGVITSRPKKIHKEKIVANQLMSTKEFYECRPQRSVRNVYGRLNEQSRDHRQERQGRRGQLNH